MYRKNPGLKESLRSSEGSPRVVALLTSKYTIAIASERPHFLCEICKASEQMFVMSCLVGICCAFVASASC